MNSILIDKIYKHNFQKFNDLIMFLLLRTFNEIIINFSPNNDIHTFIFCKYSNQKQSNRI